MLVYLVNNWLLLLCNPDGYPLRDYDGDAAADDVVARLLLSSLGDKCVVDEGVEV